MTDQLELGMRLPPEEPGSGRPEHHVPPRQWVRENLFSSAPNSAITVVFAFVLAYVAYRLLRFVFVGADWEVVRRNLRLFMVGRFPADELWRIWTGLYIVATALGLAFGVAAARAALPGTTRPAAEGQHGGVRRFWPLLLGAVALISLTRTVQPALLLAGGVAVLLLARLAGVRLPRQLARFSWLLMVALLVVAVQVVSGSGVEVNDWQGFHLTVFVTVAGIVLAFPLGLLLALGRRSTLPAIRWLSIAYIELFRGVPLITLLFMGQFVILFMFPTYMDPPGLLTRALIAIVLFEAAYIAEVVRGGLQSVSRGQVEAAQALGLSPVKVTRLVVLPQALRAVIPSIVGQFISLYKDTSLLSVIGILEILRVAGAVVTQPDFLGQGLDAVTLSFVGFLYWVGSYTMSRESRRIERRLGVGVR